MLKIEEGKYYRARNGMKIGPMKIHNNKSNEKFIWEADGLSYTDMGRFTLGLQHSEDLIAEWVDTPAVDLTKIDKPLGLLDDATREALKAHGGPYVNLIWTGTWEHVDEPNWDYLNSTIRVRPEPPKPREFWLALKADGKIVDVFHTLYSADAARQFRPEHTIIHVREVL